MICMAGAGWLTGGGLDAGCYGCDRPAQSHQVHRWSLPYTLVTSDDTVYQTFKGVCSRAGMPVLTDSQARNRDLYEIGPEVSIHKGTIYRIQYYYSPHDIVNNVEKEYVAVSASLFKAAVPVAELQKTDGYQSGVDGTGAPVLWGSSTIYLALHNGDHLDVGFLRRLVLPYNPANPCDTYYPDRPSSLAAFSVIGDVTDMIDVDHFDDLIYREDRIRRSAWVSGAGGRFSGAISGDIRGI